MRVAVLIPCLDEALTIERVVRDFRAALPEATVYVYDNGSRDGTAALAAAAGATVGHEPKRGKGHTVCRMLEEIDADASVLVDGDGTYDAPSAPALVAELARGCEMVIATRRDEQDAYLFGRSLGNVVLRRAASLALGREFRDLLSGYRVLSRRFVQSWGRTATGFDLEVALAIHAAKEGFRVGEVQTPYRARPAGPFSKLNPLPDAVRILLRLARARLAR